MTQEEFQDEARRLRPKLLTVALRYLDNDDAEDMVQDALLRLWQMVGEVRRPMDALASVLTRNLCIDKVRRQKPTVVLPDIVDREDTETERLERMLNIVEKLPPLQQTILRMRHMEGMEMADIATLIGSSEVAIRKALSRARQAVRTQYLNKYER